MNLLRTMIMTPSWQYEKLNVLYLLEIKCISKGQLCCVYYEIFFQISRFMYLSIFPSMKQKISCTSAVLITNHYLYQTILAPNHYSFTVWFTIKHNFTYVQIGFLHIKTRLSDSWILIFDYSLKRTESENETDLFTSFLLTRGLFWSKELK